MMKMIEHRLAVTAEAMKHEPDSLRAKLYRVAFLRQKAALVRDAKERNVILTEADRLYAQVLQVRLAPITPAPPNSSSLSAAVFGEDFAETSTRLHPIANTLEFYPRPTMLFGMDPIYPRSERAQRAREVVVTLLINAAGDVVNARIVQSVPHLDRAVLEAVSVRTFTPPQFKGRLVACTMTVAVPTS